MDTIPIGQNGNSIGSIFDRRVLRRIHLSEGSTGKASDDAPPSVAVIVGVTTTGPSIEKDSIVELALRRFHFDTNGIITNIEPAHVWLEDPGQPIPRKLSRLTGLTDDHVKNERINEVAALQILGGSDLIISHQASFHRPFLSMRISPTANMLWACISADLDWERHGFEGRELGWLCAQAGWFYDGHRALADIDATLTLLIHPARERPTILTELVENVCSLRH